MSVTHFYIRYLHLSLITPIKKVINTFFKNVFCKYRNAKFKYSAAERHLAVITKTFEKIRLKKNVKSVQINK